jgi:hypothetical protein
MRAPTPSPAATTSRTTEPRLAAAWATLTYAVCTMLLAWPALGGGFLVNRAAISTSAAGPSVTSPDRR